ncbi:hypothetical protein CAPTEDRAFT_201257 [Capitella teleta]|uniref:Uncharacterized protein n=1 Tax=Capitella teleta TaxID=283909 RepID=R7V3B0_CAPTE|nr:hypothetical protein CAPTEDRAFT_201257 [Capitella teleta]|eukprot:ELU10280.1 hypothetical protein CAPTEDRAFT_201257 [Capitella teleta]
MMRSPNPAGLTWLLEQLLVQLQLVQSMKSSDCTEADTSPGDDWQLRHAMSHIELESSSSIDDDDALQDKLQAYYDNYVEVPLVSMARARVVMEDVIADAKKFIEPKSVFPIGELIPIGSSTDGLKVIQPDEFDVLIPIRLVSKDGWTLDFLPDDPGFAKLSNTHADANIPKNLFEGSNLSSVKIKGYYQGLLQRYVNQQRNRYGIKLKTGGPALTLIVTYSGGKKVSVDLVPCVEIGEKTVVAKPHPSMRYPDDDPHPDSTVLWRRSYSTMEQEQLSMHYDGFTKCLMIMKSLRVNHDQLAMISSYALKSAFLHWRETNRSAKWDDGALLVNFREFSNFLCAMARKKKIYPFFESNPNANLLKRFSPIALSNLWNFIERNLVTHRLSILHSCTLHGDSKSLFFMVIPTSKIFTFGGPTRTVIAFVTLFVQMSILLAAAVGVWGALDMSTQLRQNYKVLQGNFFGARKEQQHRKQELRLLTTTFGMILLFVVTYLPYLLAMSVPGLRRIVLLKGFSRVLPGTHCLSDPVLCLWSQVTFRA